MVVTITVELAMDHKPSHRELASVLISDLYQKVISQRDIGKGMKDKKKSIFQEKKSPKNFHVHRWQFFFPAMFIMNFCIYHQLICLHFGKFNILIFMICVQF